MRISDWSSDVCSYDLLVRHEPALRRLALAGQRQALAHAEALLFVDDGQAQAKEFNVILDQRLGAHHQLPAAVGGADRGLAAPLGGQARSEGRRAGHECVSTCSSGWSPLQ